MSKKAKRRARILAIPNDLRWDELSAFLVDLGYEADEGNGSRTKFRHAELPLLSFHRPHNPPLVRQNAVRQMVEKLREEGVL